MDIQDNPEEILKILIDLQNLEAKATTLQKEIDQIPVEISQNKTELATYSLQLETAKTKSSDAEKNKRSLEGEVESLRQKISNYKTQLMSVKTNSAYQAMLHEISFVEEQITSKEDLILEHMLASDGLSEEVGEVGKIFEEKKQAFAAQKTELESLAEKDSRELETLGVNKTDLENALPKEHLARYRRVASARNGQAVAPIDGQNCSACHVRLRPQLIAEVKAGKNIIQCESCSRILIAG
jgi:uncharacterized protein